MITTLLIIALENALQNYLKLDKATREKLIALSGKVIQIHLKDWDLKLFIFPNEQGVRLQGEYENVPDVSITGSLSAFVKMSLSKDDTVTLPADIDIEGDAALAQRINRIMRDSQIDWEEILAMITGDGVAHRVGNKLKSLNIFKQQAKKNMQENITEYLQEEKRLVPPREEVEDFFEDIDILKNDVERLGVRLKKQEE